MGWIGAVLIIILLAAFLLPNNRFVNWMQVNAGRVATITGPSRWMVMQEAVVLIGAKPLTGYGMDQGNLQLASGQWVTSDGVHNTILQNWLGGGVLAFLGALMLYGCALVLSAQTIRAYLRRQAPPLSLGLAVSIIGWTLIDMTQPSIYLRYTWITAALLFGFATAKSGGWSVWFLKSVNQDAVEKRND
jgi:O-antigen ligase